MKTIVTKPIDISILKGTKHRFFKTKSNLKKSRSKFLKSSDKKKLKSHNMQLKKN